MTRTRKKQAGRVEMVWPPALKEETTRAAEKAGLNLSDFVRRAVVAELGSHCPLCGAKVSDSIS